LEEMEEDNINVGSNMLDEQQQHIINWVSTDAAVLRLIKWSTKWVKGLRRSLGYINPC
jgi:hypothetical protein